MVGCLGGCRIHTCEDTAALNTGGVCAAVEGLQLPGELKRQILELLSSKKAIDSRFRGDFVCLQPKDLLSGCIVLVQSNLGPSGKVWLKIAKTGES